MTLDMKGILSKLNGISCDDQTFSENYLKMELKVHYGDDNITTSRRGKQCVLVTVSLIKHTMASE